MVTLYVSWILPLMVQPAGRLPRLPAYDTLTDGWKRASDIPHALVTTTTVPMPYGFVVPGGADRPGHRSAEVLRATPARKDGG
jgi:hypothetical protein